MLIFSLNYYYLIFFQDLELPFIFSILLAFICSKFSRFICLRHNLFSCHPYVYLKRQVVGTFCVQPPQHWWSNTALCRRVSTSAKAFSTIGMSHALMPSRAPPVWYSESERDVAQMVLVLIHVSQGNQVENFSWSIFSSRLSSAGSDILHLERSC